MCTYTIHKLTVCPVVVKGIDPPPGSGSIWPQRAMLSTLNVQTGSISGTPGHQVFIYCYVACTMLLSQKELLQMSSSSCTSALLLLRRLMISGAAPTSLISARALAVSSLLTASSAFSFAVSASCASCTHTTCYVGQMLSSNQMAPCT